MSEIAGIMATLEARVDKLLSRVDSLEAQVTGLKSELAAANGHIQRKSEETASLQAAYDNLKHASTLLGSEETKRDTKLKINALIREIDYCITQLAD
jgi:chromosome segregation ATPase